MSRSPHALARHLIIVVCLALGAATGSLAQGRGGAPPGGGGPGGGGPPGGGGGMSGGGMGGQLPGNGHNVPGSPGGASPSGINPGGNLPSQLGQRAPAPEVRAGVQLGPPGRWWDDRGFARNLKLRPEQQARMDLIFDQNRGALLSRFMNVQQAEMQMQALSNAPVPNEAALFAQIDRVSQARAELEKAKTHLLLQLRKEMDGDQIQRLEKESAAR